MAIPYSSIRNELNTGDLVLFSGKGGISKLVKFFTASKWSHVGVILRLPSEYDFLTIWESVPYSDIKDLESNKPRNGVRLVALSDRVRQYSEDISVRRLEGAELSEENLKDLMGLRRELRGKSYERDMTELFNAVCDGLILIGRNDEDLSSIFCSELVAEAYQRLGLLSEGKPSNEYVPKDFSQDEMDKLENGFYLSKEIVLKDE